MSIVSGVEFGTGSKTFFGTHEIFEFKFEMLTLDGALNVDAMATQSYPLFCWNPYLPLKGPLSRRWLTLSHVPTGYSFINRLDGLREVFQLLEEIHAVAGHDEIMALDETPLSEASALSDVVYKWRAISDPRDITL